MTELGQFLKHLIECPAFLNLSHLSSALLLCVAQKNEEQSIIVLIIRLLRLHEVFMALKEY